MQYTDIREAGVDFLSPHDAGYSETLREMLARRPLLMPWPDPVPPNAAILCNNSGQRIVAFGYVWTYRNADGRERTNSTANLASSSMQLEFFLGRPMEDDYNFIAPRSRRLITEEGMFGDNFDVLPMPQGRGGFGGAGGGGGSRMGGDESAPVSLGMDFVILDDGRFAGPDRWGRFVSMQQDLDHLAELSASAARLLREGSTAGAVFDLLHPHVHRAPTSPMQAMSGLLELFAKCSIAQLSRMPREDMMDWFDGRSRRGTFPLRRV